VSGAASSHPNAQGWYGAPVTIVWTCSDELSHVDGACPGNVQLAGEGEGQTATVTVSDVAGNSTTATTAPVNIDLTAPTATIALSVPGTAFEVGQVVNVSNVCADVLSGIASCVGTLAEGAVIDTSSVGVRTLTLTGTDKAGHVTTVTLSYTVFSRTRIVADPVLPKLDLSRGVYVLTLRARLTAVAGDAPLAGRQLVFWAGSAKLCTATTDATGVATCNGVIPMLSALLNLGYRVEFAGEQLYKPSTGQGQILKI
jgi:hypothetical protein